MIKLTDERRKTLKAFLLNAGTVFMAGLVIGSFVRPEGFNLSLFAWGGILYTATLTASILLDASPKKEE